MQPSRSVLRAIVITMATTSPLGFTKSIFAADDGRTPGSAGPKEAVSGPMSPYTPPADVYVPESSKAKPEEAGKRGHTNILIRKPNGSQPEPATPLAPKQVRKKRR